MTEGNPAQLADEILSQLVIGILARKHRERVVAFRREDDRRVMAGLAQQAGFMGNFPPGSYGLYINLGF